MTDDNVHRSHWPGCDRNHGLKLGGDKAKLDPFWLINRSYDLSIGTTWGDKLYMSDINPQTSPFYSPLARLAFLSTGRLVVRIYLIN